MVAPQSMKDTPINFPAPAAPVRRSAGTQRKAFILALLLFLAIVGKLYLLCLQNTGGHFVYPLDDTYIHLALARTLAEQGIWGMNAADGFASAASSLAWPVQLAGLVLVFGAQEWLPLALNLIYGVLALVVAYLVLGDSRASPRLIFWTLLLLILFTSLPVLVLLGMEHTMQAAVCLLFAQVASRVLAVDRPSWKQFLALGMLAMLVTATRYEGAFLILAVAFAALLARHWKEMLLVPVLGALPIVGFGLYSLAQGSMWLPNPIAVKSNFYDIHTLQDFIQLMVGVKLNVFLTTTAVLLPLLLALLGMLLDAAGKNQLSTANRLFILIVVLTAGMHLFGATTGWFARYEAYLVFLTLLAAVLAWQPLLQQARISFAEGDNLRAALVGVCVLLLVLVLAAPFLQRMNETLFHVPTASKNIHDQQIQMARFVKKHYDGQPLVINDLGAIAFFTDARPVDMAGLATLEVAREITNKNKSYEFREFLDQLARDKGARVAIIYTTWLPGRTAPAGWTKAGSWTIRDNVICGSNTVDFYALDAEAGETLAANLRDFARSLPADVIQKGY